MADWHEEAFGALYPIVYAHRDVALAAREAAFAVTCLGLTKGDRLLDLGCGGGRHLVHLRKVAGSVVGFDFSETLLASARRHETSLNDAHGRGLALVRGDMRVLPFGEAFDAVVCFFTSLGYFEREPENETAVAELSRTLHPGGRFFIDHLNGPYVERTLIPESFRERDGYGIRERRWIDTVARRVNKTVLVTRGEHTVREWRESVRMYTEAEFRGMLSRHGLAITETFGDFDGSPLADERPRMILVGRKEHM